MILRRQRTRLPYGEGVKSTAIPSRFFHSPNTFEFSGWGTLSQIELEQPDLVKGEEDVQDARRAITLGQFTASALAGNAVLGSVFYALPAVVAVAGVLYEPLRIRYFLFPYSLCFSSPISLFVSTLVMFLWRPIMEELASALPISGAPYTYLSVP